MRIRALPVLLLAACGVVSAPDVESQRHSLIIGADNRVPLPALALTAAPQFRAVGLVVRNNFPSVGPCTAFKISPTIVATAAHCIDRDLDPTVFRFWPAAQLNGGFGNYLGPEISVVRVVRGTGGLRQSCSKAAACGSWQCLLSPQGFACSAFEKGADFALLEVNPASYTRPSSKLPTWASVPILPLSPIATPGLAVTPVAYQVLPTLQNTMLAQKGCGLNSRVTGNALLDGVLRTDCDLNEGAAGAPVFLSTGGSSWNEIEVLAMVGADAGVGRSGDMEQANEVFDIQSLVGSPWDAVGIAGTRSDDGTISVFATDRARPNQIVHRAELPFTPQSEPLLRLDSWRDARGGLGVPNPTRLAATIYDSQQFVFAVGSDQRVYANWQLAPNASFNGWAWFFENDLVTSSVVDVAANGTSSSLFVYVLGTNGAVNVKQKWGGWAGPWDFWTPVGATQGLFRMGAADTEGYPVIVAVTPSAAFISWAQPDGTGWVGLQPFTDSLPAGLCNKDIKIGLTPDGKLDVFLLADQGCNPAQTAIFRRTKTSASAGSPWGGWVLYRSATDLLSPELKGATALGLLPPRSGRGDGLLFIKGGAVFTSGWSPSTSTFLGWTPFYGPVRPW